MRQWVTLYTCNHPICGSCGSHQLRLTQFPTCPMCRAPLELVYLFAAKTAAASYLISDSGDALRITDCVSSLKIVPFTASRVAAVLRSDGNEYELMRLDVGDPHTIAYSCVTAPMAEAIDLFMLVPQCARDTRAARMMRRTLQRCGLKITLYGGFEVPADRFAAETHFPVHMLELESDADSEYALASESEDDDPTEWLDRTIGIDLLGNIEEDEESIGSVGSVGSVDGSIDLEYDVAFNG